jgi:hypothetical protein
MDTCRHQGQLRTLPGQRARQSWREPGCPRPGTRTKQSSPDYRDSSVRFFNQYIILTHHNVSHTQIKGWFGQGRFVQGTQYPRISVRDTSVGDELRLQHHRCRDNYSGGRIDFARSYLVCRILIFGRKLGDGKLHARGGTVH